MLVAEDEPLTQTMVAGYFHNASDANDTFTVTKADNLAQGKKALDEKDIDLLWTDNNMPHGNDGLELLAYAQTVKHPPKRSFMFSAPAGFEAAELEKKAKEAGAHDFFNKNENRMPLNIRMLVKSVLEEWLDRDFSNIPRSPNTSRKPSRMMSFQSTNSNS